MYRLGKMDISADHDADHDPSNPPSFPASPMEAAKCIRGKTAGALGTLEPTVTDR
jgi:hypothetical protein